MPRFTRGELAVMRLLWRHGEMKPSQIQRHFPEPIKNSALRSYLTILFNKGHVGRRKIGKAYVYKAATPQQSAYRSTLRELIEVYCAGSVRSLMLNLIRTEKLSASQLVQLKRLADEQPEAAPSRRRRKRWR
ncbi:MAG: BlaI/MecI/CopY family transcriptional regulator [Planctomycetaceae bacterium]